jgi:hypothetical protein
VALAIALQSEERPAFASGAAPRPAAEAAVPDRLRCDEEAPRPDVTAWPLDRELRARTGGERVVPVVVHMMRNTACAEDEGCRSRCPSSTPTCLWTPEQIDRHFRPTGLVNEIWKQAGIRLAVVAVRQCDYYPTEFRQAADAIGPGIPEDDADMWAVVGGRGWRYNEVSRRAGISGVLNLFIWLRAERDTVGSITYFGSSPRHPFVSEPKRSIVWTDTLCVWTGVPGQPESARFAPDTCARKLAHEVGHALTLKHIEAPDAQGARNPAEFTACRARDTTAGAELNLMLESGSLPAAQTLQHVKLTAWQRCQARSAVVTFFTLSRFTRP